MDDQFLAFGLREMASPIDRVEMGVEALADLAASADGPSIPSRDDVNLSGVRLVHASSRLYPPLLGGRPRPRTAADRTAGLGTLASHLGEELCSLVDAPNRSGQAAAKRV
jgi:hypothetical protein